MNGTAALKTRYRFQLLTAKIEKKAGVAAESTNNRN